MGRAARERVELAAAKRDQGAALEACDLLTELFRAGYTLFPLAPSNEVKAAPVRLRARGERWCAACRCTIAEGGWLWWTRGVAGVECDDCGGRKAA